jgi:hypothetical protein
MDESRREAPSTATTGLERDDYGDPLLPNPETDSLQKKAANRRNESRIDSARKTDDKIISKYLPSDPKSFITKTVTGPGDYFCPPPWLMEAISEVAAELEETPSEPPVSFAMNLDAAHQNSALLEEHGFDFDKFLSANDQTTLGYGSEFRPISQLKKILGEHPNFPKLDKILSNGMDYRFKTELPECTRSEELAAIIERGNHKSAESRAEHVAKALGKDVRHGFSLPILPATVLKIKGTMAQPLGMAEQLTLTESGERIPKFRLTQDLSFPSRRRTPQSMPGSTWMPMLA